MGQVMWLLWLLQLLTGVDCWSGAKQLNSPHNLHMTGCYGDSVYMKVKSAITTLANQASKALFILMRGASCKVVIPKANPTVPSV